jgi:hypothetical protein
MAAKLKKRRTKAPKSTITLVAELSPELCDRLIAIADVWKTTPSKASAVLLSRGIRDAETMLVCRGCGCTENDACYDEESEETCHWVEVDWCNRCAERGFNG